MQKEGTDEGAEATDVVEIKTNDKQKQKWRKQERKE